MKNSFKINIEQLRQEGLKELFGALEGAFKTLGIDFYLIGANGCIEILKTPGKSPTHVFNISTHNKNMR